MCRKIHKMFNVSKGKIGRDLQVQKYGVPFTNATKKLLKRSLLWALRHLRWTITQWKRVLWSDQSVFTIYF